MNKKTYKTLEFNKILSKLSSLGTKILLNIWGNHEYAILNNEYESFSTV